MTNGCVNTRKEETRGQNRFIEQSRFFERSTKLRNYMQEPCEKLLLFSLIV